MLELLSPLWEPFGTWDAWVIAKWYFGALFAAIAIAIVQTHFMGRAKPDLESIPTGYLLIIVGFIMPVLEELIFRGIPAYFGGLYLMALGTGVWALLHGKRALIVVPFGILWMKMWMAGFGIEATVMHILHNAFIVALLMIKLEGLGDDDDGYDANVTIKVDVSP